MNEVEKITNFQKIKAMNIDEMASWLGANTCNYCVYQKVNCDDIKQCKDGIKQWLESEEGNEYENLFPYENSRYRR